MKKICALLVGLFIKTMCTEPQGKVLWISEQGIVVKVFTGKEALYYWQDFSRLIVELYKGYPYLFECTMTPDWVDHFKNRALFQSPLSEVVILFHNDLVIGYSYSIPLSEEIEDIQHPVVSNELNPRHYLYVGDTLIHHAYQGKGFLKKIVGSHEQHAKQVGCSTLLLTSVDRPIEHPCKPVEYRSPDTLWSHMGFEKMETMKVKERWLQVDTGKVEDNVQSVWCKKLVDDLKGIKIEKLSEKDVEPAIEMVMECWIEIESLDITVEQAKAIWEPTLEDYYNISGYSASNGLFLIARDGEKIIGSGAVRKLDDSRCEIKRMYVLKEYRCKKIGYKIVQQLLDFAKSQDCKEVYLDVWNVVSQGRAIEFYKQLGFAECEPYNDEPAALFMRKTL